MAVFASVDETFERVIRDLERLRRAGVNDKSVFGAAVHGFEVNPPLPGASLRAFEVEHGIVLPADYRAYLAMVGNGGAGPLYGVFKLGEVDDGSGYRTWAEGDFLVGVLSEPFPHTAGWNDLTEAPDDNGGDENELEAYDQALEAFEKRYWSTDLVNGAIPICHEGCALRDLLVVTGPEAGHIWHDGRADEAGLEPMSIGAKTRVSFLEWYLAWLDGAVAGLS